MDEVPPFDLLDEVDLGGLKVAVVRAALELDLCTLVAAGRDSVALLADELGANRPALERLVAALCSLEVLVRTGDRLSLSPMAAAYLVRGGPADVVDIYLHWLRNRDHLVELVRTGSFPSVAGESPELWVAFARQMLVRWPEQLPLRAEVYARRGIAVPDGGRVLDVGCGSGIVAAALLRGVPTASAVLVDHPAVLEVARQLFDVLGLTDRAEFVDGDARLDGVDGPIDVAALVNVAQYLTDDELTDVLTRLHGLLRPGGMLMFGAVLLDEGSPGNSLNWTSGIEMLLAAPGVRSRTADDARAALHDAGFRDILQHNEANLTARA